MHHSGSAPPHSPSAPQPGVTLLTNCNPPGPHRSRHADKLRPPRTACHSQTATPSQVTVAEKGWKHQAKKAQLQESSVHIVLDKLEARLRAQQAAIFQASEVVKARESEMDYQRVAANVAALVDELNACTIRAQLPAAY
jgi:predicted ATPase